MEQDKTPLVGEKPEEENDDGKPEMDDDVSPPAARGPLPPLQHPGARGPLPPLQPPLQQKPMPPLQQQQQFQPRPYPTHRVRFETKLERKDRMKKTTIEVVKEVAKTLGLIVFIIVYGVLGAIAFEALEQTNEKTTCLASEQLYGQVENTTSSALWSAALNYQTADDMTSQIDAIQSIIQVFMQNVVSINYPGTDCSALGQPGGPQYYWNFPGSLLFSITVYTTVGYGNIAPKTAWGRMFCIAYALIGIPLMFFTLANIGEHMALVFRFIYIKLFCLGFCTKKDKRAEEMDETLTTSNGRQMVVDDDEDEDDEDAEIAIPLTMILLVVAGYLIMGALLFAVWEGWDAMAAAYFTFITISTIGLGDIVPGFAGKGSDGTTTGNGTGEANVKMIVCSIFMLLGMSLLSMAFDLIQYELADKFHALGVQNIGKEGDTINELQGKPEHDNTRAHLLNSNHHHQHQPLHPSHMPSQMPAIPQQLKAKKEAVSSF